MNDAGLAEGIQDYRDQQFASPVWYALPETKQIQQTRAWTRLKITP